MSTSTPRLPVEFIDVQDHHDAVDQLKLLSRGVGFVITIERTKQDKSALKQTRKVFLRCWKSRPYKSTSKGLRQRTTRSTECPWRGCLSRQDGGWRVEVKHPEHNHELDEHAGSPGPAKHVARRQVPKAPLRQLAALSPYPPQGAHGGAQPPPPVPQQPPPATTTTGQQYGQPSFPAPFPPPVPAPAAYNQPPHMYGQPSFAPYSQFPSLPPQPQFPMPAYSSNTPPGSPPRARGPPVVPYTGPVPDGSNPRTRRPRGEQPAPEPSPSAGVPRTYRRAGYAVMSEIKRYEVPLSQRLVFSTRNSFRPEAPSFLIYQPDFNNILGDEADLKIAYEDKFPFAHGAAIYSPQRDAVFVTSAPFVPHGRYEKIVKISRMGRNADGTWIRDGRGKEVHTLAVLISGGTNNGDGLLFCAQGDYRDYGGLVHIEADVPYKMTMLVNNYNGRRFNSISDVIPHSDGSLWFTDAIYGFEQGLRPKPDLPSQVYRFDPVTGDIRVVADGFGRPKSLCFASDEKALYVADTDCLHGDGSVDTTRAATIYAYDIMSRENAKFLINRRVFAMPDTGVPHKIDCDDAGNVYAACGDGLNVWNSSGTLIGKVLIPGGITGLCFGKPGEMFLLNETKFWLLAFSGSVRGAQLARQKLLPEEDSEASVDSMASLFGADGTTHAA
ncbi:calcium-dependent phosphotriesterase [Sporormia fimetaria CBS 119925]|uniref:Calcium-dependent phosphotriesterase n=1 Tax=Sporormia fimetaria CBS 119925 TaxID=1340428 RepID=A0A6A6VNB9_9PLEO|nr:calcium-dependent phosphotriesterase [Sporormia fimetaria CBS 119925]